MPWRQLAYPITVYFLSTAAVFLGVQLAIELRYPDLSFETAVSRYDASHYIDIVEHGYHYNPSERSTVAFFPFFPVFGSLVGGSHWSPLSMLAVANVLLCGSFVVFWWYLRGRDSLSGSPDLLPVCTLLAFALFPTTFVFRMPYSESSFLLLALLAMAGMSRKWPPWVIALVVGACTATRPVGVALLVPFTLHLASRSQNYWDLSRRVLWLFPLAYWGILAYMVYQWIEFGEPLAFAKTQEHWQARQTGGSFDKALSLASLEPIWATYIGIPSDPGWEVMWPHSLFAMRYVNPIYFVGTAGLIMFGRYKRWLAREEFWLGAALLFIPYVTRSYEWTMLSHGRFAAVAFPMYIVLGHFLSKLPDTIRISLLSFSAVVLSVYAALFASGRDFF